MDNNAVQNKEEQDNTTPLKEQQSNTPLADSSLKTLEPNSTQESEEDEMDEDEDREMTEEEIFQILEKIEEAGRIPPRRPFNAFKAEAERLGITEEQLAKELKYYGA